MPRLVFLYCWLPVFPFRCWLKVHVLRIQNIDSPYPGYGLIKDFLLFLLPP